MDKPERKFGMDEEQLMKLATFNAERGRGLVHTPEWEAKMEHLERIFNWHSKMYLGTPVDQLGPPPPRVYVPPAQRDSGTLREMLWLPGAILLAIAIVLILNWFGQL